MGIVVDWIMEDPSPMPATAFCRSLDVYYTESLRVLFCYKPGEVPHNYSDDTLFVLIDELSLVDLGVNGGLDAVIIPNKQGQLKVHPSTKKFQQGYDNLVDMVLFTI